MCTLTAFFSQDLADFDVTLTQTQEWCDGKAVEKITLIRCYLNLLGFDLDNCLLPGQSLRASFPLIRRKSVARYHRQFEAFLMLNQNS